MASCDLHVHSIYSTDSGNYALRRARLGESFTPPERVYETCLARGMNFVTISDHNSLDGALRIADRPNTFLSVEVTTRFPEDDVPLHVLVWDLSEEDHRDLQPLRPSVYELVGFLRERGLTHALAHPLFRMGVALTASHVERMMLLFEVWEGRNGARPANSNDLACRLAAAASPEYLAKLSERHGIDIGHRGQIGLTGGSDDHGAIDIATTWTLAEGRTVAEFLTSVAGGISSPQGEHGSTVKLAHAVGALAINAYRRDGRELPQFLRDRVAPLFDEVIAVESRHEKIKRVSAEAERFLGEQARAGGVGLDVLPTVGHRLGLLLLAGTLEVPYIASMRHFEGTRRDAVEIERAFFGLNRAAREPRSLVFTDTFHETNGVAGTMRRLAAAAARGELPLSVVTGGRRRNDQPGLIEIESDWSLQLPSYELIDLQFPTVTAVLSKVEEEEPELIHVATPGPMGLCGLIAAKVFGLPLVGSWHTELGPYALHLTRDALVADTFSLYVDWFYRQCTRVLAPTHAIASRLEATGLHGRVGVWGRGVDHELFNPARRSESKREELLRGGDLLLLSVGRVSEEKRLGVLLDAFARVRRDAPGARLAMVGDGPARAKFEEMAGPGVSFLGELHGEALADVYANADVFCFPSTTDTFGQVLLEAGASGLPVVAAAIGGATELVESGTTGLLVAPDESPAFADAITTYALCPSARIEMGERARSAAVGRSWERSLDELLGEYVRLTRGEVTEKKEALAA
jgi:glycosyltransferase involved in cell wall biosynthesis/predicted metal-dependent phosphoesterase TrpH